MRKLIRKVLFVALILVALGSNIFAYAEESPAGKVSSGPSDLKELETFMEMDMNGRKVIGHPVMSPVFRSMMALLPEQNIGIFISMNTSTGDRVIFDFQKAFISHYYSKALPAITAPSDWEQYAKRFTGSYRMTHAWKRRLWSLGGRIWYTSITVAACAFTGFMYIWNILGKNL